MNTSLRFKLLTVLLLPILATPLQAIKATATPPSVLAQAATPQAATETAWYEVVSNGFSVLMPGRPMNPADTLPPPPSDSPFRDTRFFILDQGDSGGAYFLADTPNHNASIQHSEYQREAVFNRVRDRFIETGYRVLKEQSLSQDGYPGRDLELEQVDQSGQVVMVARARVYLTDRRVYLLQVGGLPELVYSPDAERFLNSFKQVSSTP